jgi:hypothetical protein
LLLGMDWTAYSAVLQASVDLLNRLSRHLSTRIQSDEIGSPLPPLVMDAQTFE